VKAYLKGRPRRARWVYVVFLLVADFVRELPVGVKLPVLLIAGLSLCLTRKGRPTEVTE
jgi:hypothetical protein